MKKLIVNSLVGVILFGGSLVGGLAATGRLNHDGVANIPMLSALFPEPSAAEAAAGAEATAAEHGAPVDAHAAPGGEVQDAGHSGDVGVTEASHGADADEPQEPQGARRTKTGKSIENPEPPPTEGGHGGGHGEEPAAEGHGDEEHGSAGAKHPDAAEKASAEHGPTADSKGADGHAAERDFSARELALAQEKTNKYAPGGYFAFPGMPAGLTPDKLNEAWQRVQGVIADLEKRKVVLDLRAADLKGLAEDIDRRHRELGKLHEEILNAQRALDERIAKFQDQVKLVRNDEVAAMRRNAQTFESFEPSKAAELITEQWGTEEGQTEILKTFEFMDKDKVNSIIQELANPLIQDVLKKRLRVSKEAAPSGGGRK
ncbi:MAG: hypothetical protein KDC98_01400 [Planctomycetes bacterium]|nr:hypothetical protein [Planctomycetota bacterium]